MERLDACYFCGTAADAPLREVSISPRDRRDDPDAAVRATLCPSCERKLERVLAGLFDHVESRRVDREAADVSAEVADAPADRARSTADPTRPAGGEAVDRIDVSSGGRGEKRGRRRLFTDPSDVVDAPADTSDGPDAETAGEDGEDGEDAEIIDDEPRVRARAASGPDTPPADVSVDEYNRVMRLLQNREFPLGRRTFVDLAADAYDIGQETVEQVLDAAIKGGALAEREGQLVRPDEESP